MLWLWTSKNIEMYVNRAESIRVLLKRLLILKQENEVLL